MCTRVPLVVFFFFFFFLFYFYFFFFFFFFFSTRAFAAYPCARSRASSSPRVFVYTRCVLMMTVTTIGGSVVATTRK